MEEFNIYQDYRGPKVSLIKDRDLMRGRNFPTFEGIRISDIGLFRKYEDVLLSREHQRKL